MNCGHQLYINDWASLRLISSYTKSRENIQVKHGQPAMVRGFVHWFATLQIYKGTFYIVTCTAHCEDWHIIKEELLRSLRNIQAWMQWGWRHNKRLSVAVTKDCLFIYLFTFILTWHQILLVKCANLCNEYKVGQSPHHKSDQLRSR